MPAILERSDRAIPKSAGTYVLILLLRAGQPIQVGKLGSFDFPAGYYIYIGSAFGSGGLAGRLGRHLAMTKPDSPLHWHIDYLRDWAPIVEIWFSERLTPREHLTLREQLTPREDATPREHDWAALVSRLPGSNYPAPRFGASDCRCRSHLFRFEARPSAEEFRSSLSLAFPTDGPLHAIQLSGKTNEQNDPLSGYHSGSYTAS